MRSTTSNGTRVLGTAAVATAFSLMLAGTSKAPEDDSDPKVEAAADAPEPAAKSPPKSQVKIPSTQGWQEVRLDAAGVKVRIPPGAKCPPQNAGNDESFSGQFFNVVMGDYMVNFAQNTGEPVDIANEKKRLVGGDGFEELLYEADDALVSAHKDGPPAGEYWETTACSKPVNGRPLCTASVGASVDATEVTDAESYKNAPVQKLTHEQCLEVVAIARSVEPLE